MSNVGHLDYETASAVDLKAVGAHRYAIDPSTRVLMAGVSADTEDAPVLLWVNPEVADNTGENAAAEALLRSFTEVYAHNAPFEQAITWGTKVFPIRIDQWRCTAAMSRKAGLPWKLETLAETLGLPQQKDKKGAALIRFFSIERNDPRQHPEKWLQFCEYCRQDVRTEKAAHRKLKAFELTGDTLASFQFDLRMNQLGVPVNTKALRNAQKILDEVREEITKEFVALTGVNPTQREEVRFQVELPNMQAETVEAEIQKLEMRLQEDGIMGAVDPADLRKQRILQLYALLSYAAVKKVSTMLDWACPDDRMRGCFLWHGASTGRWSSRGPQMQNAKKPTREMAPIVDMAYGSLCDGASRGAIEVLYGNPYEVIASSIRQFVHAPGQTMLDGDYNAIEGRIGCWIAGQTDILEDWRNGKDLYRRATAFVEEIREEQVTKEGRSFGKVVELACQFGLGTAGFMRTCAKWGIACDEEKARRAVHVYYRPTHDRIVQRWYDHGRSMLNAIAEPGTTHGPFTVRTIAGIKYLLLRLPSGRCLAYPHIEVNRREPTDDERKAMLGGKYYPDARFMEITYWGQRQMSALWGRIKLHGSLAFQNEVQAIAADLITHGALAAEARGMAPFALIHDQGLSLANGHSADEYAAALATAPAWAKGLPLKVEAKETKWYTK